VIRDCLQQEDWFNERVEHDFKRIAQVLKVMETPAVDRAYEPQYAFELAKKHIHLLLRRYSRGDPIGDLSQHIPPLLDAWEQAERLGKGVWTEQQQFTRHAWSVNLDHYIRCFWLVGLALTLEVPDEQWQRLLVLIGNEGEDALLDRVIATRQQGRPIGSKLCHPKPYQRLLDAVDAAPAKQPVLLREFVQHWYPELDRLPKRGLARETAMYERPYWYEYHKVEGGYFGYWCIEAVAAVKAFGLDDTLCLGLVHYPGDLLRPDGPTTHLQPSPDLQRETAEAIEIKQSLGDRVRRKLFAPRQ
jgi:Domain of unknown function (DUF1911)/Domain of unknown function (DUF1910)